MSSPEHCMISTRLLTCVHHVFIMCSLCIHHVHTHTHSIRSITCFCPNMFEMLSMIVVFPDVVKTSCFLLIDKVKAFSLVDSEAGVCYLFPDC